MPESFEDKGSNFFVVSGIGVILFGFLLFWCLHNVFEKGNKHKKTSDDTKIIQPVAD